MKAVVLIMFVFLLSLPALAKPRDVFPGSCDNVWSAIAATLSEGRNYGIVSMDDLNERATFTVIGDLTVRTDKVTLVPVDGGCQMKIGRDANRFGQFRRALLPKPAEEVDGPAPGRQTAGACQCSPANHSGRANQSADAGPRHAIAILI
jgi:hypothetical protein